jgi:hypothetical protein
MEIFHSSSSSSSLQEQQQQGDLLGCDTCTALLRLWLPNAL